MGSTTRARRAAARRSLSLELLSRDHPSTINGVRPLLHTLATADGNAAVRRLAILCLKNGSAERNTIVLLEGLAADDEADAELRRAAGNVAQHLKKKQREEAPRRRSRRRATRSAGRTTGSAGAACELERVLLQPCCVMIQPTPSVRHCEGRSVWIERHHGPSC